ncbi:MAG: nucleotide exchange factor GrpE [Spirochaetaceae bacterium]|jgi:molecular chaperone GrpE|nr:nucleotide exchange factor GrpE [Spirochaetaceae bacterium]
MEEKTTAQGGEPQGEETTAAGATGAGLAEDNPLSGAEEGAAPAEETPEEAVARLTAENEDLKEQLLRRAADFDNYRKRMIREKQDAFDYANAELLKDLLDSLDNFDRALEAAQGASDIKTVVEGIEMTKKRLVSLLETKYNLASYGEPGDPFSPDEHEAIASVPAKIPEPLCGEVYLKGYKLKDRVIRHAKVLVNMPE